MDRKFSKGLEKFFENFRELETTFRPNSDNRMLLDIIWPRLISKVYA